VLKRPFTRIAGGLWLQQEMKTTRREKRAVLGRQRLETREARKAGHFRIRRLQAQSDRAQIAHIEYALTQPGSRAAVKDEAIAPEERFAPAKIADPCRHACAHRSARDFLRGVGVEQDIEPLRRERVGIALRQLGIEKCVDMLARPHQGFGIAAADEHDGRGRAGGLDCAGHRQRVHDVAQIAGMHQTDAAVGTQFRLPRPPELPRPADGRVASLTYEHATSENLLCARGAVFTRLKKPMRSTPAPRV
jgi:hypothetical protein